MKKYFIINTATGTRYSERFKTIKAAKDFINEAWLDEEDRENMVIDWEY